MPSGLNSDVTVCSFYFLYFIFFSVRLLSVLRGHSVFSSPS